MVTLTGGPTEFRKVSVFKPGSGSVQDSAGHNMAIASKGAIGWLASNRLGDTLAAEPSTPVTFAENAPVVDRSANPIAVQAGEVIGHWGEHQAAAATPSAASNTEPKAVHVEVFVAHKDKQALEDCLNNKAQLTGGQRYPVAYLNAQEAFLRIGVTPEQLEWKKFHPSSPSVPNTVIPGLAEEKTEKLSLNEAIERAKKDISNATGIDSSAITISIKI